MYRSSSCSSCSTLVGELGALAPDVLEAVGDVLEQLVDRVPLVAETGRGSSLMCLSLDRCVGHVRLLFLVQPLEQPDDDPVDDDQSTMIATIGDRSSGPSGGRMRRKSRRYGLADVVEEPLDAAASEYGSRIHDVRM